MSTSRAAVTRSFALCLPLIAIFGIAARKPDDPKHENHYKAGTTPTSSVVALGLGDAQSQATFIQVDAKITNTTGDQLLVLKKAGAAFVLPNGTFPVHPSMTSLITGPNLVIPPNETRSNLFRADGDSGFHVDSASLQITGLWSGPNVGTALAVPDFALPPSRNDFTSGPFTCKISKHSQSTDQTAAVYTCTYNGAGAGIVEPSHISVRAPNGQVFANDEKNEKRQLLLPGDTSKFSVSFRIPAQVVDMQFATLQMVWNDALAETTLSPVALTDWTLVLDEAATTAANK